MSRYVYNPLDKTPGRPSFRLLILHPDRPRDEIRLTFKEVYFADSPVYVALSYAWGDPATMSETKVVINGADTNNTIKRWHILARVKERRRNTKQTHVRVRQNLLDALLHFRRETEDRVLWIDALCIN